ncbi:DNA-3-methyladenine glycosylase family protein [Oceanibacterium hippocampi]|uniref:DNA-3-methyladenine glycosylase II n=1 Tax=Oceanibacterium hippocampi TaxID=745714 RepID=A0A1Y5RVW6_9PROT|nr:hypothetical protein [Oceanibacterium hippocampi]SLN26745.1 DNA-3-methyladenine glycosylase [Oceanibacterium hippocampi]
MSDDALAALAAADPDLARIMPVSTPLPDRSRPPGFETLARIIVQQQVSLASAAAIWSRLEAAIRPFDAETLLGHDETALRALGLSRQKALYLSHLSTLVADGTLDLDALHRLDDEAAQAALVAVKGVGRWTAEIYLMFALGREDIWPAGDIALQEAIRIAKGLAERPKGRVMDDLAEPWRPHRAVAARLLWSYYRHVKGRAVAP